MDEDHERDDEKDDDVEPLGPANKRPKPLVPAAPINFRTSYNALLANNRRELSVALHKCSSPPKPTHDPRSKLNALKMLQVKKGVKDDRPERSAGKLLKIFLCVVFVILSTLLDRTSDKTLLTKL